MTELKDGIKKIILAAEEGCECQQRPCEHCADGIAQSIADALVVDEKAVNSELLSRCGLFSEYQDGKRSFTLLRHQLAKAISEAKPIKCEVE